MTTLTPVLSRNWADDRAWTREAYEAQGGYQALRKAMEIAPDDLIEPKTLAPLARTSLKEAFRAVARVQRGVANEYGFQLR